MLTLQTVLCVVPEIINSVQIKWFILLTKNDKEYLPNGTDDKLAELVDTPLTALELPVSMGSKIG